MRTCFYDDAAIPRSSALASMPTRSPTSSCSGYLLSSAQKYPSMPTSRLHQILSLSVQQIRHGRIISQLPTVNSFQTDPWRLSSASNTNRRLAFSACTLVRQAHGDPAKDDAWRLLLVLFLGQLVAFSMAACSFASSFIANLGVDTPLAQSFCTHLLLTLVYVPILLRRRQKLRIAWYWYLALAFVDVQGNYLVTEAYQYSSITSVTLLDCWTVVWAMILTWYAVGTRYSFWQFLGAGTCVAGLALVLLSDAKTPDAQDPNKIPLLGDALVIAGTVCYAFSNVGEEHCVKKNDRVEVVAMLGLFGVLVSTVQILIFERKSVEAIAWSSTMISLFAGYAVAGFMFYTITPFVLKMSGATLFNLSLLTSDMWAVAIRVFFYQQQINWLYYLAFTVVAIGLIIYSLNESSSADGTATSIEAAAHYQQLPSEDSSTGCGSNLDRKERQHRSTKKLTSVKGANVPSRSAPRLQHLISD